MKKKNYLILLLCIIILSLCLFVYNYQLKNGDVLPYNIYIGPVNVSKLSREDANEKILEYVNRKYQQQIILKYKSKEYYINLKELITFDKEKSINEALNIKKGEFFFKSFFLDFFEIRKLINLPLYVKLNDQYFNSIVNKIENEICIQPQNAKFIIKENKIQIVGDKEGTKIDEELLKKNILNKIFEKQIIIEIPILTIKPFYTKEKLQQMNIKYEIASFSTKFNLNQIERSNNLKLASERLNGTIIAPMEIFSFNETVGERTKERGYLAAPIYFNNEISQSTGGGVCQISTTLYNLVLLTDLEVVERHHHSMPVGYVPPGRDATVSYDSLDLKFKNNTGNYLVLFAEVKNNSIIMKFYSSERMKKKVDIISEIITTTPPSKILKDDYNLEMGKMRIEEGRPGCKVKVWKIINNNGKIEKKLISTDIYKPLNTIVYVGKKIVNPSLGIENNKNNNKELPSNIDSELSNE